MTSSALSLRWPSGLSCAEEAAAVIAAAAAGEGGHVVDVADPGANDVGKHFHFSRIDAKETSWSA